MEPDEDEDLPQRYWTTVAMKQRAAARLELLDAQLNEVLIDLATLLGEAEGATLSEAQQAWKVYRECEMRYVASRYEGGTIAGLVAVAHAISLTEHHIEQMREEVRDRKQLTV